MPTIGITCGYFSTIAAVTSPLHVRQVFCSCWDQPEPTIFNIAEPRVAELIDDALLEVLEVSPTGAANIDDGSDANAEREAIGRHAIVAHA